MTNSYDNCPLISNFHFSYQTYFWKKKSLNDSLIKENKGKITLLIHLLKPCMMVSRSHS